MATNSNGSRVRLLVVCLAVAPLLLVVSGAAQQNVHTIPADRIPPLEQAPPSPRTSEDLECIDDCGNSDDSGATWGYICELGSYQAWFGFDLSSIPDGETITALSFTALMENYESYEVERSLWHDASDGWIGGSCPGTVAADELVSTILHAADAAAWETFDLDLSTFSWQDDLVDDRLTLMLSGPTNGDHECGGVYFFESESVPFITVVTGAPVPTLPAASIVLLILMLSAVGLWIMRS